MTDFSARFSLGMGRCRGGEFFELSDLEVPRPFFGLAHDDHAEHPSTHHQLALEFSLAAMRT